MHQVGCACIRGRGGSEEGRPAPKPGSRDKDTVRGPSHQAPHRPADSMSSTVSGRDFGLGVLTGAAAALLLAVVGLAAVLRSSDLYGLGHWKLNLRTPLASMWMNLGYW